MAKIRQKLEKKLRELTARTKEIDDDLRDTGDDDWEEQATESEDDEVLEEVGEAALDEIRQIKFALSRIEAGKYGVCAKCGRPIAKQRLTALPHATRCVKCS
jgi:RNA polymerase-binding transcription factor DksA